MLKVKYCLRCQKIKEDGTDEWVESKTDLTKLRAEGLYLEPTYCDGCGSVLDGIAKEQRIKARCDCLNKKPNCC